MIATMYLDDSEGRHSRVCLWAGLLGPHDAWTAIHNEWAAVLKAPPEIPYWHSSKIKVRNPERRLFGLTDPQIEEKEMALAGILHRHREYLAGLVVRLSLDDHDQVVRNKVRLSSKQEALYPLWASVLENKRSILFQHAVAAAAGITRQWTAAHPGGPEFSWCIFEEDLDAEWQDDICLTVRFFKRAFPDLAKRLGPVVFLPGKGRSNVRPLEAADLYAWHWNRRVADELSGEVNPPQPAWSLLSEIRPNEVPLSRERLQSYVRAVSVPATA